MIGSTRHSFKFLNVGKNSILEKFISEYSSVCAQIVDLIWERLPEDLEIHKFQNYKSFKVDTNLFARAFQCCVNQAAGIVRGAIEKQRRVFWAKNELNIDLPKSAFSKPRVKFIAPQLNCNCVDIKLDMSEKFEGFIKLHSLGQCYGKILIPINKSKMFDKWKDGELSNSIKFLRNGFQLSWTKEVVPRIQGDKVVGVDQGFKSVATLSDGQVSPSKCPHGHEFTNILEKMSRKKKGSKGFQRAQTHRKNFVNWSINQLNFSGLKEVRLEKIVNIRKGKNTSRIMSHWSNPEIRDKIKRRCEELEVPVVEQSCAYRSQRCNQCELVRKANRKGKIYSCPNCNNICDADLNAAKNHEVDLPDIPYALIIQRKNLRNGFFWKSSGFFEIDGSEFIVPDNQEKNIFQ